MPLRALLVLVLSPILAPPPLQGRLHAQEAGPPVHVPSETDAPDWAAAGAAGWDYQHCLPYFRRAETWMDGADAYRGADGPLSTSNGNRMRRLSPTETRSAWNGIVAPPPMAIPFAAQTSGLSNSATTRAQAP